MEHQFIPLILVSSFQAASEHKDEFYSKLYNSRILWDSPLTQTGAEQVFELNYGTNSKNRSNFRLRHPLQCESLRLEIERTGLDVDVTFVSPLFRTLQVNDTSKILRFNFLCIYDLCEIPDSDVELWCDASKNSDDRPGWLTEQEVGAAQQRRRILTGTA